MKYSSRGLMGTIFFHLSILLILLFFGFSFPDPPPEEQGVLVNFGTDLTGLGDVEPSGSIIQGGAEQETKPIPEETVKVAKDQNVKQKVKLPAASKNSQNLEETSVKVNKLTDEELKQIENQKNEAKAQKAEEDRRAKIAEKWNAKGQNAFDKKGVGAVEGSQGITEGTGNQGNPNGVPESNNYGDGGGLGNGTTDPGLKSRGFRGKLQDPNVSGCIVTSRIIIKVQIIVDRDGNVAEEPKIIDRKFQDDCIEKGVINAAATAKLNADQQAPLRQQGWIIYIIEP